MGFLLERFKLAGNRLRFVPILVAAAMADCLDWFRVCRLFYTEAALHFTDTG